MHCWPRVWFPSLFTVLELGGRSEANLKTGWALRLDPFSCRHVMPPTQVFHILSSIRVLGVLIYSKPKAHFVFFPFMKRTRMIFENQHRRWSPCLTVHVNQVWFLKLFWSCKSKTDCWLVWTSTCTFVLWYHWNQTVVSLVWWFSSVLCCRTTGCIPCSTAKNQQIRPISWAEWTWAVFTKDSAPVAFDHLALC